MARKIAHGSRDPHSAIALLAEPGKLVGFLLLADASAIDRAPSESDCIFSGIPYESSLLSHPLCSFVQEAKHVEFRCTIQRDVRAVVVKLTPSPSATVEIHLGSDGKGHWTVIDRDVCHSGICELA
jgi:hypothetical protein